MTEHRRDLSSFLNSRLSKLLVRGLIAYSLGILIVGWSYEVWRIHYDRVTTIAANKELLRTLSAGFENLVEAIINDGVGGAAAAANDVIANDTLHAATLDKVSENLGRMLTGGEYIQQIFIATPKLYAYSDAENLQRNRDASSKTNVRPAWVDSLMQSAAQNPNLDTWIGDPLHVMQPSGRNKILLPLARKMPDSQHANLWVGAMFDVEALSRLYKDVRPERGVIALLSTQGEILLRMGQSPDSQVVGRDISKSKSFTERPRVPEAGSVFTAVSPITNQPGLYAVHRIKNYEMISLVGREMHAVLAPWAERTRSSFIIAAIMTLVLLILTWSLKRLIDALARRNSYYRTLFDNSAVSVMLGSGDYFIEVNATAHKMFRIPPSQSVEGLHPWEISPERQANGQLSSELAAQFLERVVSEGQLTFEWLHKRMDSGEVFPAQVNLSSVTIDDETYILALVHDMSDLARTQQELQSLNAELEQRVTQRTDELRRAYLSIAAANEELESFTAAASHDLRSPLGTIAGQAGLLEMDIKQTRLEQAPRRIARIHDGVARAGEIIDGLLSLARVSRQELLVKPIDFSAMAREVMRDLQSQQPERVVDFSISVHAQLHADPRLMNCLLVNLLGNAWKYTSKKSHARIELIEEGETFSVRDNGEGFAMDQSDALFQPFRRLHAAEQYPGLGVGLATVARIVRRYNGRIWAMSDPNTGTVFYFTLPQAREVLNGEAVHAVES